MRGIDRAPTALGRGLSGSAAVLGLVPSAYYAWHALAIGGLGVALVVVGLRRGSNRAVTVGAFGLFLAAVVAGLLGAPVLPVLASTVLAAVAWDVGGYAVAVGDQLGRAADTRRIEVVHAAASAAVGGLAATAGYAVYLVGAGSLPATGLLFLVVAAVLLVRAFA